MYILATDYDGTLNRGGVAQEEREAIAEFRAKGNLFGVVTGRASDMYDTLVHDKVDFDFVIVMNGAMILNGEGRTVDEQTGDACCIRGITELIGDGYGHHLSCVCHKTRRTFHSRYPDGNGQYNPMSEIDGLSTFTMMNTWVESDELAARAVTELNERFSTLINALQNGNCIDIPPHGIDKGVGLARYAERMGVPFDNVWCAGDNCNDLAMLTRFHGCAVVNARPEVKSAAEFVCSGIAEVVRKILGE